MPRVPFENWPQKNVGGVRVLIARNSDLTSQGLAGATAQEFGDESVMFFLRVIADDTNCLFDNKDEGYGTVNFDIGIAFLDENFKVIGLIKMAKRTGRALPPRETKRAVEALPDWFQQNGFIFNQRIPPEWQAGLQDP